MDRKLRRFHKRKENGGRPVEKKQRLRMMRTELSIEEQIMLAASNKLYSNRNPDKGIRIVTVICYFFSISLAAILLSIYYVYFWHPEYKNSTVIRNTNCDLAKEISARTINATEVFYNKLLKTLRNAPMEEVPKPPNIQLTKLPLVDFRTESKEQEEASDEDEKESERDREKTGEDGEKEDQG